MTAQASFAPLFFAKAEQAKSSGLRLKTTSWRAAKRPDFAPFCTTITTKHGIFSSACTSLPREERRRTEGRRAPSAKEVGM